MQMVKELLKPHILLWIIRLEKLWFLVGYQWFQFEKACSKYQQGFYSTNQGINLVKTCQGEHPNEFLMILPFTFILLPLVMFVLMSFSLFTFMHRRRKWQPTPVFLPREPQGLRGLWAAIYGMAQGRPQLNHLAAAAAAAAVHRYQRGWEQSGRITYVTVKQYFSS